MDSSLNSFVIISSYSLKHIIEHIITCKMQLRNGLRKTPSPAPDLLSINLTLNTVKGRDIKIYIFSFKGGGGGSKVRKVGNMI